MPAAATDHVGSFAVQAAWGSVSVERVPLAVGVGDEEFAGGEHEHDFDLGQRQLLPDAAPRPPLEGAPGELGRVQRVAFRDQPAFGHEVVRPRPVLRVVVQALMVAPDQAALGWELLAGGSGQGEAALPGTERGRGRVQTKGFFDHREREWKLTKQLRRGAEDRGGGGHVTENGVVFSAQAV